MNRFDAFEKLCALFDCDVEDLLERKLIKTEIVKLR